MKVPWSFATAVVAFTTIVSTRIRVCHAFNVFGYVPEYRTANVDWNKTMPHLTHCMLFSIDVSPRGSLVIHDRLPDIDSELWRNIVASAKKYDTKLLVTVGGAGRSQGFGEACEDADVRSELVKNVISLVHNRGLDGIDFDVIIPAEDAGQKKLASFFTEMHQALKAEGKLLTLAIHPGARNRVPEGIIDQSDYVHLMAYDNWCAFPHTAKPPCLHSTLQYARDVVKHFLPIPHLEKSRVNLGIPFYGRHVIKSSAKAYSEIAKEHPTEFTHKDELGEFYFNSIPTIKQKIELVAWEGLGGVMLWEIGQDLHPDESGAVLPMIRQHAEETFKKIRREDEL